MCALRENDEGRGQRDTPEKDTVQAAVNGRVLAATIPITRGMFKVGRNECGYSPGASGWTDMSGNFLLAMLIDLLDML